MRLFFKASHGLLTCKGTQKDVGSSTSWSTFHLVNDIKSPTAFLIHIWCLWTNWGRRIQERISINAWFHKFDPNFYCLRTLTHFCLPKALGQRGTCFWKQAFLEEKPVGHKRSVNKAPGGRPFQQGKHTGDHFSKENTQESGWEERKTTPTSENDEQDLFLSDGSLARWKFCKQRIQEACTKENISSLSRLRLAFVFSPKLAVCFHLANFCLCSPARLWLSKIMHMQPFKTSPRDDVGSGGQGVDLQGPRVTGGRPTGSQAVKGFG